MARFKVHEHFNGYELEDTVSGQRHWLSDGVDCVFHADETAMSPGTPEFIPAWEESFNADGSETLEAYFPEQAELETQGQVKCTLCEKIIAATTATYFKNTAGKAEPYCAECTAEAAE